MRTDRIASRTPLHTIPLSIVFVGVAALTSAGMAAAAAAHQAELRWKFTPGAELVYRQSMFNETQLPQGMGASTTEMETTQRWSVLEVTDDGDATIRVTTEGVRMSVGTPMGTMTADSADPAASSGTPLDAVTAMAGTSYTIVMSPAGEIKEISGVDEMREAILAEMADPSARTILEESMSDETIRGQWSQGGYALPADAVGVGSTWDSLITVPVPTFGSMTIDTDYAIEAIDGDVVHISSTGTMSMSEGAESRLPVPMEIGATTMDTMSRFDVGRGLLIGTDSKIMMQMSMTMGDQQMVLDAVMTMTLELVEDAG